VTPKLRITARPANIYTPSPSQETARNRRVNADQSGAHLWIVAAAWRIPDPASIVGQNTFNLDHENMISLSGPRLF